MVFYKKTPSLSGFTITARGVTALSVGLSATAFFIYMVYRQRKEDELLIRQCVVAERIFIDIKIPSSCIGAVIGRGGCNLKRAESEFYVRVSVNDAAGENSDRIITIRGLRESATEAEKFFKRLMEEELSVETLEYTIPRRMCGSIIGKNGTRIREMSRQSRTKILVTDSKDGKAVCRITGSPSNISYADGLIQQALTEGKDGGDNTVLYKMNVPEFVFPFPLISESGEEYFRVYVSAISPSGYVFIQLINEDSLKLDYLVDEMTDYYSMTYHADDELTLSDVSIDDFIAVKFSDDAGWYRAKVADISDGLIDVDYIDYGDSTRVSIDSCRKLRHQFTSLQRQSVCCRIKGVSLSSDEVWNESELQLIETLTHCSKWRELFCSLVETRGDCKIPTISFRDDNVSPTKDITEELIAVGVTGCSARE